MWGEINASFCNGSCGDNASYVGDVSNDSGYTVIMFGGCNAMSNFDGFIL